VDIKSVQGLNRLASYRDVENKERKRKEKEKKIQSGEQKSLLGITIL